MYCSVKFPITLHRMTATLVFSWVASLRGMIILLMSCLFNMKHLTECRFVFTTHYSVESIFISLICLFKKLLLSITMIVKRVHCWIWYSKAITSLKINRKLQMLNEYVGIFFKSNIVGVYSLVDKQNESCNVDTSYKWDKCFTTICVLMQVII